MTNPSKPATTSLTAALTTSALILGVALVTLSAASVAFAQAAVTLPQNVTVYRAFYYDGSDNLLHVEVVRNAAGRSLQTLLSRPKVAPQVPPTEGPAVLVGDKVRYAVYYGLDSSQPTPRPGDAKVQSKPLAVERLTDADTNRPIECATQGEDVCLYPHMCHCGAVGGCCCF